MNAARVRGSRGASLIEVMLAVALTAVTALGLIATQLWIARDTRAAALRERAALLSDALAEAARAPAGGDTALRQWSDSRRESAAEGRRVDQRARPGSLVRARHMVGCGQDARIGAGDRSSPIRAAICRLPLDCRVLPWRLSNEATCHFSTRPYARRSDDCPGAGACRDRWRRFAVSLATGSVWRSQ